MAASGQHLSSQNTCSRREARHPPGTDAPHRYLSACTGKKKRKEGKEQPQADAARSCGLRGRCRHCGVDGLAGEGREQEVVVVVVVV